MIDVRPVATPAPHASLEPYPTHADPIGGALRELLAIFADALGDVKFPDVDAAALVMMAKQVEDRDAEVRRAELAVDEARRRLNESQDQLLARAHRAAAYARVFADGNAALTARLDALALPRPRLGKPGTTSSVTAIDPPKKRGRPRNVPEAGATLFAPSASTDPIERSAGARS